MALLLSLLSLSSIKTNNRKLVPMIHKFTVLYVYYEIEKNTYGLCDARGDLKVIFYPIRILTTSLKLFFSNKDGFRKSLIHYISKS